MPDPGQVRVFPQSRPSPDLYPGESHQQHAYPRYFVAQIFNLLYRRIAFCRASANNRARSAFGQPADYKSAIRQFENLRYAAAGLIAVTVLEEIIRGAMKYRGLRPSNLT